MNDNSSEVTIETFQKTDGVATPARGFVFETERQRNVSFINKGITKPGRISFDVLRRAAQSVHVARICINVLKEKVTKTKWVIKTTDPTKNDDDKRIKEVTDFFKHPNKNDETFRTLLDKMLEDLLVLDSVSLEKTRFPDGTLAELHFVDAATIRPVFDKYGNQDVEIPLATVDGMQNLPVSYVQVLNNSQYGGPESGEIVAAWPKKDFIYFHQHPQGAMEAIGYGLSPLEGVLSVVANLLNADNYNGTYFEEGSFPPVIIQMVGQIAQRDVEAYRQYLYSELSGNFHRPAIMAGANKAEVLNLKNLTNRDMEFMEYTKFLARLLAAAYGLSGQDIGLTEEVGSKNVSETMSDLSNQKGYGSLLHLIKEVFNQEIVWKDFGYEDLEFDWVADDTQDPKDAIDIHQKALQSGIVTLNEAREKMGYQPFGKWADVPAVLTASGYVVIDQGGAESGDDTEVEGDQPKEVPNKDVGGERNYKDQKEEPDTASGKSSPTRKSIFRRLLENFNKTSLEEFKDTPVLFGTYITNIDLKQLVSGIFERQDAETISVEYKSVGYSHDLNQAAELLRNYIVSHPDSYGGLLPEEDIAGTKYTVFIKENV